MTKQITIIGGGIAGLTTAIALNKKGFKTQIFESASEINAVGAGLGLGANAIMAFDRLGLKNEVIERGRALPSFSIYDQKKKLITRTDSHKVSARYGVDNFTIHRAELHQLLLSKIDTQSIHTNKKVKNIQQKENSVLVKFQDGTIHETEFLIAADGIHSTVRKILLPDVEPRYSGYTCWRAVLENTNLNLTESSETWGTKGRFGIVPLAGNKVYWFACVNSSRNNSGFKNFKAKDILDHFQEFHEPIPSVLKETKDENLLWNDIFDLKPINKFAYDNILLVGDAAHATTPNLGQGACQAIEDAVVLTSELSKVTDVRQAFRNFEKRRVARTQSIVNTSWKIGKVAQLENKILVGLRNFVFRITPSSVSEKQLEKLYNIDF